MKIALLLSIIVIANCYTYGMYQTGNGVGVFSQNAPSHILMTQSDIGRSVDIEV